MIDLECALKKFCKAFGRDGDIGKAEFGVNASRAYPAELPTSKELTFMYCHLITDDEVIVGRQMQLDVFVLEDLLSAQDGWRWFDIDDPRTLNPDWNLSWVVFANRNDDVLVADTSIEGTPVLGCIQGETFLVSSSLERFWDVYSEWMLCERDEFHMDAVTADFSPKPEFLAKLSQIADSKLSKEETKGFLDFFFG